MIKCTIEASCWNWYSVTVVQCTGEKDQWPFSKRPLHQPFEWRMTPRCPQDSLLIVNFFGKDRDKPNMKTGKTNHKNFISCRNWRSTSCQIPKSSQSAGSRRSLFFETPWEISKAWPDPKKRVIEVVTDMATVAMTQAEDGVLGQGAEAMSLERRRAAMFLGDGPSWMLPTSAFFLCGLCGILNVRLIQILANIGNK